MLASAQGAFLIRNNDPSYSLIVFFSLHTRTWWWDSWVEPNDLYHIYQPFALFVSRLNMASLMWSRSQPSTNGTGLRVWGMAGESGSASEVVLAWIQDNCFTWSNQHAGKQCQQRSALQVVVPGCQDESGV